MSVTPRELHATTAEVTEFLVTLTALCIVLLLIAKLYPKLFDKIPRVSAQKIIKYAEPTSVLGALVGVVVFLFSIYTGIPRVKGGAEALVKSPLIMNLVMTSVFALEFWVIFLVVRAIHGKEVWNKKGLFIVYAVIGLAGFLFTIETGSLGHRLAGRGSILDPFYEFLNINPERFYALGTLGIYALIGICILAGIFFVYSHRGPKKRDRNLSIFI